ncbi:hypothetical protein TNCV_733111 [Trichonephila clavipes]|nr:hypothetical protein TNCV_733111 [Trichonephila clavipes]
MQYRPYNTSACSISNYQSNLGKYYTIHQAMSPEIPVHRLEGFDGLQFVGQAYPTHALLDSSQHPWRPETNAHVVPESFPKPGDDTLGDSKFLGYFQLGDAGGGKILELAGNVVLVMKGASLDVGLGGCEDLRQYLLLKKWLARGVLGLKMMWK